MDQNSNAYRDKISTVDNSGKRLWVYPKKPKGKFYDRRKILSYLFLAFLFGGPYIKIGGEPLLLLNVLERKFVIFGQVFWPQDTHIFALIMLTAIVFLIVFTVIFGRLFCGWVCPQTIFMEMVFRRIEYWTEGDWTSQKRLNKMPWNAEKIRKKALKHFLFIVVSFLITNTLLSYLIGYEKLWQNISEGPATHFGSFISLVIFTGIFYAVFSKFREQVCTVVCPYGRLQDVLLDKKSLVVIYDFIRGENRGKIKKNENREELGKGDCIDCNQCVNVCPTGIDIRNGTQLECVNCTACIDACNDIMAAIDKPKGLIRYDSLEGVKNRTPFQLTVRVKTYIAVLILLMGVLTSAIALRDDFEATVLRTRGTLFQEIEPGLYSNLYDLHLVNKGAEAVNIELEIIDNEYNAEIRKIGNNWLLNEKSEWQGKFMIVLPEEKLELRSMYFKIAIKNGERIVQTEKVSYITPGI